MKILRDELVLIGLDLILTSDKKHPRYTREDLGQTLDISVKTLNSYLTELKNLEFIQVKHKKFVDDIGSIVDITSSGRERLDSLWKIINSSKLTPEYHNIPTVVNMNVILDRMRDPLEKLFFLSVYYHNKEFDLMAFLSILKITLSDSTLVNVFDEISLLISIR